ncbi:MAG: response regulator [Planctomycetes bacterium]|nr:response regulator [Planctomycetota bacterium]
MVVDDHPDSAEATAQLLALHGHDARAVHSRSEALATVGGDDAFAPEVVILDVRLPDGDGFTLAAELCRALPVRPGLIVHTGLPGLDQKCRAAGFDHYVLKPADPAVLVDLVGRYARPT